MQKKKRNQQTIANVTLLIHFPENVNKFLTVELNTFIFKVFMITGMWQCTTSLLYFHYSNQCRLSFNGKLHATHVIHVLREKTTPLFFSNAMYRK